MDSRDGLRFAKNKSWVHVRASNTEPVLRVIAEAPSENEAYDLCKRVEQHI
jgi:phosphomannomutase